MREPGAEGVRSRRVIELRWDPILSEWVMISNIRESRPWRPTSGSACPFCPGSPEVGERFEAPFLLENRFPMLVPDPPRLDGVGEYPLVKAPGRGECYVIVESLEHDLPDLSSVGVDGVAKVIEEVADLTRRAMGEGYAYVLWFRNRGEEVGVSLTHPHSQVYVTPFTPSKVLRELTSAWRYFRSRGECLFCKVLEEELRSGERVVLEGGGFVAFVPFYAHWPFEVHIYPERHVQLLTQLSKDEVRGLAEALVKVLKALDKVFDKPMPYVLATHQAPLRGEYPHYHLHIEIYGMLRASGKLKYAAGMEQGGGNFTYDSTPEDAAERLRQALRRVEEHG